MNFTNRILVLAAAAATLAACDPKAPVASSDIDAKIAAHASDPNTHANLIVQAANISGTFDGSKITDNTVTTTQLADDAVTDVKIIDGAITPSKLAANSVTGNAIAPGAVTATAIGANAVQTAAIGDLMVTTAKIANAAIDGTKLAAAAVANGNLGANAVQTGNIMDGQVMNGDLANASVDTNKLANAVANGNIAANAVDSGKIMDGQVANADLAANAVDSGKITDGQVMTADLANLAVDTAKIADNAVTDAKLNFATHGQGTSGAFATISTFRNEPGGAGTVKVNIACVADSAGSQVQVVELPNTAVAGPVTCPNNGIANPPVPVDPQLHRRKQQELRHSVQVGNKRHGDALAKYLSDLLARTAALTRIVLAV